MKKNIFWSSVVVVICITMFSIASCFAEAVDKTSQQTELKQACLSATMTAIQMEIDRYQKWIELRKQQGDSQALRDLEGALVSLQADLEKYRNMNACDYVLPEKVISTAWVQNKPAEDALLYIDMMSKSGPFYHLAGIAGNDYSVLQPGTRYDMTFYKIYPRSYWNMDSDYVYIAAVDNESLLITNQRVLEGGPLSLRNSSAGINLAKGFLDWSWGSRPDDIANIKYIADIAPDVAVYSTNLDISPITGEVRAHTNPKLIFLKDGGLVLTHIDFEYKDYEPIKKRLTQLLGDPNPIIYELWAARIDFEERSEWRTENTRVVLTTKGKTASLEISKRDCAVETGSNFSQMLAEALLKQAQEYDQRNLIPEASSIYQTLLNDPEFYNYFTDIAEKQLAVYSQREEAVDYLTEYQGMRFFRLKNMVADSIEQPWIRIDLGTEAQAELQNQRPDDIAVTDGLTNLSAVLCRMKVNDAAGKFEVVEQIWLDEENRIIGGRPAWAPQDSGWPVLYIRQACETFMTAWFSFVGNSDCKLN